MFQIGILAYKEPTPYIPVTGMHAHGAQSCMISSLKYADRFRLGFYVLEMICRSPVTVLPCLLGLSVFPLNLIKLVTIVSMGAGQEGVRVYMVSSK